MGFKGSALAITGLVLMTVAGFAFLNFLIEVCMSLVELFV